MTVAPAIPNSEPTRKPMLLPIRCISSAAGNTQIITPICCIVTGRLARLGAVIEGDDRKPRRRKHHGVAGLADRLAAGEQQEIAVGAPVEGLLRIGFRPEPGIRG